MEKKAYVERIMAFITNQQTGRKEEGGEPAPVSPVPESWTIDGVTYYNRCVFDLEELLPNAGETNYFDVLTSEKLDVDTSVYPVVVPYPCVRIGKNFPDTPYYYLDMSRTANFNLSSYSSQAFTVVDTQEEVTDNTKICLPTCSAYYGFLSEDGKTFISYFNLKD